ncbi:MAG: helix-turn-helix domain-containing protein [Pelosinus sp.]|nr:helix-turn-helix domain-containing protein [Pelosinus sp.]
MYGNPVTAQRIADSLFVNERTIRRYLAQLEAGSYICLDRRVSGFVIFVRKSMKWHTRQAHPRKGRGQAYRENAIDRLLRYSEEEIDE